VLTHRTLLAALWGGNYVEQNEYLRVFVGNLRKKIEPDAASPATSSPSPGLGIASSKCATGRTVGAALRGRPWF
jgi:hypothetical protein